jgi:2-dehydro-3-deoxyphosphogluconate aldolase/(4S)-4-hydroxy-2-oxoglutarate aldolase
MTETRQAVPIPTAVPDPVTALITRVGVIAVLRAPTTVHFSAISETLVDNGLCAIEIALTPPDALDSIATMSKAFGDNVVIGAGGVITADQAEACVEAGAEFLVSPTASPDVVAAARIARVPVYPGALTPTEILAAHRGGASAVRLFPASVVGPRFVTYLHGPMPQIEILATGGIAIEDVASWISAGAAAVGLGRELIQTTASSGVRGGDLARRARQAVEAVAIAREAG